MPVRPDSILGQVTQAAQRRRPLFRITVSPRFAHFLIAAGAQPAPPAEREWLVEVSARDDAAESGETFRSGRMAVYHGLVGDAYPFDPDDFMEEEERLEIARIQTLHPRSYNEARTIGEVFRAGTPVLMDLSELVDSDAKRLIDFAAGLIFGVHGSIERITNKVFLLSPANLYIAAEDKAQIAENVAEAHDVHG